MKAMVLAGEVVSGLSKEMTLIVRTMRPLEWIKNVFVFAPVFFSGEAEQADKLVLVGLVFLAFSAMSSAVYIFNDVRDREFDRTHPSKRERPIASGALPVRIAIAWACLLAACSMALVHAFPPVLAIVLAYGGMNILYSLKLKHIVILDVFTIAVGFVLRV